MSESRGLGRASVKYLRSTKPWMRISASTILDRRRKEIPFPAPPTSACLTLKNPDMYFLECLDSPLPTLTNAVRAIYLYELYTENLNKKLGDKGFSVSPSCKIAATREQS